MHDEFATRSLCVLAEAISVWAKVVVGAAGDGFSIHIPFLACKEQANAEKSWSPTGYGDTVEQAASNLMKKLAGYIIVFQDPALGKPWVGEAPFCYVDRAREAA